ncbi:MAG: FHA domain-containing protein [Chloroflexi bacterium]|nr:FHA domain-containing protein [Chloroflexota bacterium]
MSDIKSSSKAFLLINGDQVYYLEKDETSIGRSGENDLVLNDQRISRKHAKISIVNDRHLLVDLNSSGGSYVNGKPVVQKLLAAGDVLTFAFGDKIIFGEDKSIIPDGAIPYSPEDRLAAAGVTTELDDKEFKDTKTKDESEG